MIISMPYIWIHAYSIHWHLVNDTFIYFEKSSVLKFSWHRTNKRKLVMQKTFGHLIKSSSPWDLDRIHSQYWENGN